MTHRILILALTALASLATAQQLSLEQKEQFLLKAKVLKTRDLSEGITNSRRATLQDGDLIHDAHLQTIDEYKTVFQTAMGSELNFSDSYKYNIAAYKLDRMLGLGMTPPSVVRKLQGATASVTWWVDDTLMTEKERFAKKTAPPDNDAWNRQMFCVRVFDELIYNTDRNLGNLVIDKSWTMWMIDHTRGFRMITDLKTPANLVKVDRQMLAGLRKLDEEGLRKEIGEYINKMQIKGLLARRDRIVKFFDGEIAKKGEAAVLVDLPERR